MVSDVEALPTSRAVQYNTCSNQFCHKADCTSFVFVLSFVRVDTSPYCVNGIKLRIITSDVNNNKTQCVHHCIFY
jgi:hypothetical protein